MKLSVSMITYNHENFIAQAIESVLMQQTNFDFELVIGEDCSTDRTRAIIADYAERFPDKIRLLPREKNLGASHNFVETLQSCRGQYLALLEGDDYWTSPHKLQKQVDLLDSHPECVICFHNVKAFYQDESLPSYEYCDPDQKEVSTLDDLLVKNFIPTCSTMFRRGLFGDFPDWFHTSRMGDWPLHIFNARHGNIRYINENMGAYRLHNGGAWFAFRQNRALAFHEYIEAYNHFREYLGNEYADRISVRLSGCHYNLAMIYLECGDLTKAKVYLRKCLTQPHLRKHLSNRLLFRLLMVFYSPRLYKFLKPLRQSLPPTA